MVNLRVIEGTTKTKVNYLDMYLHAFSNTLKRAVKEYEEADGVISLSSRKKIVWYGVNVVNNTKHKDMDYSSLLDHYNMILTLKTSISNLTPREFKTMFPITKTYVGLKYECKDYFCVKQYIEEIGKDDIIGSNIDEFFWNYMNPHTDIFSLNTRSTASRLCRMRGERDVMEDFLEGQGISTYTVSSDAKGKRFATNNSTGMTQRVDITIPRHLKVIK